MDKGRSGLPRGVFYRVRTKKYHAQITIDGNVRYLGTFENKESASRAYTDAALKAFGTVDADDDVEKSRARWAKISNDKFLALLHKHHGGTQ